MRDLDEPMGAADDDAVDGGNEPLIEEVHDGTTEPMEGVASITELNGVDIKEEKPAPNPNEGEYTWVIPNFSALLPNQQEKMHSEEFMVGDFAWDILLFPRGNREVRNQGLSLYLNVSDAELAPPGWLRKAQFRLTVVNQANPEASVWKEATHDFCARGVDWGFTTFMALRDVLDPKRGFLKDDTLEIRARVVVEKAESMWYDSKKETGFVGLKNQGATCYMNSLLQFLYNINFFRQAVYHMPTSEEDDPLKSIPLALQSLFYKLQFGDTSVSTKDLTKSFGWDTYDAFMQHDVQELNRVLQEKLEDKMKGTKVEGTIARLFEGHMHMFIECIDVDVKSTRRESYMDLQLDVKGAKNIYESFDKYCEVEVMDGANQYKTDEHGLQDARKGVLFDSFPPVLQLQLKRFEYDFQRDIMVKINDRYEFPDELDLDCGEGRLLSENADRSVRNLYSLHAVLVHSGGVHGGHYYAFIRPDGKRWLKFDDERVSVEDARKAMVEQYGGEDEGAPPGAGFNTFKFTKYSNAYMLVYVRKSDWDQIMCEVTRGDIQEHVRLRLEAEREDKERRRKEKAEAHLFSHIRVVTDADLAQQIGATLWFDLVDHDKVKQFRVRRQTPLREFREQLAADMDIPLLQQRLWTFAKRQNNTLRPARPLDASEDGVRVCDIKDGGIVVASRLQQSPPLLLFLETPVAPQTELPQLLKMSLLLFLKVYDQQTQTLRYAGRVSAMKSMKYADLVPLFLMRTGLPKDTQLQVYEEVKFEPALMCDLQNMQQTLHQAQLEDGDILCLQREPTEEEKESLPYPTVKKYLEWVRQRMTVTFRRLDQPKEEGITLELSRETDYDGVCEALYKKLEEAGEAQKLGLDDPQKLRLTAQQPFVVAPKPTPLRWGGFQKLHDVMTHYQATLQALFWEALDLPLRELEQLKTLKVYYHGAAGEQVSTHEVRLPKDSCVADVLQALNGQLPEDKRPPRLRLLEVFYSKIYKIFALEDRIDTIDDRYWMVRAEGVPAEEIDPPQHSRRIHVYHFNLQPNNNVTNFGNPFLLQIGDDETLAHIKQRIQAKLGVSDEEFARWRFAYIDNLRKPDYLEDDEVVAQRFARLPGALASTQEVTYLGLEHADTGPRQRHHNSRGYSQYERPVKIYN